MPIKTGFVFFPLLAFIITIPYMFFQYRKYGSINKVRTLIIYSFILYLTVAYFLIILPLPNFEEVSQLTTPRVQLIPFSFITDFINNTSLIITNPSTYLLAFKEPYIYQVLYNLILFLPLGIYLHYYFKCSLLKTTIITFLVSLFFEITQLTGLYFIYPRGYRLFDVDDLIINTLGGFIGYLVTSLFTFFLPSREEIDEQAYLQGRKISFLRRVFAFLIDQFIILIIIFILPFKHSEYLLVYFIYYMLIPIITKGLTIGKQLLKMRITDLDGNYCRWYQYTFRYTLQYIFLIMFPTMILYFVMYFHVTDNYLLLLVSMLLFIIYIGYLFLKLCMLIFNNKVLNYEKISKTINTSTIKIIKTKTENIDE